MATINDTNFGQLHIKSSMRTEAFMGIIFLAIGLGGLFSVLTSSAVNNSNIHFQVLFLSAFTIVGMVVSFGRRYIYGEKNSKRLYCWWGVLGLGLKNEYDVSQSNLVNIKQVTRGGSKNRRTYYVVSVNPVNGGRNKSGEAVALIDYCESRQVAEAISRFLNVPLCDYIAGGGLKRDPDTLDWSVRERLTNEGRTPKFPELSDESKIEHVAEGKAHRIIIPPRGICLDSLIESSLFAISAIFLLPISVAILYLLNTDQSLSSSTSLGGTAILIFVVGLGSLHLGSKLWDSIKGHCEILVSRERLVVEMHGLLSVDTNEFAAEKIEEVLPARVAKVLLIRSDEKVVTIGRGLDNPDLYFIKECIEYALCN